MKRAIRALSLFLSVLMMLACLSGLTISAAAEENTEQPAEPELELEYEDKQIPLFQGGQGGPHGTYGNGQSVAVKYTIPKGATLQSFFFHAVATYSENESTNVKLSVYQWDKDYETTVAGEVLATVEEAPHKDNAPITVSVPEDVKVEGTVLLVMENSSTQEGRNITPWASTEGGVKGVTYYANGTETTNAFCVYANIHQALSMDPTFKIDFGVYTDDPAGTFGLVNANDVTWDNEMHSGYITFHATGKDPYVQLTGATVKGLMEQSTKDVDWIVVTYRTTYKGNVGMFVSREDGVQMGQDGSHVTRGIAPKKDVNGLPQWHAVVVNASEVWGNTDTKITNIRLDMMDGGDPTGHSIDVASLVFFSNKAAATVYCEAQSDTITLKGEMNEGDEGIFQIGESYYTSDTWFELKENLTEIAPATGTYTDFVPNFSCDTLYTFNGEEKTALKDGEAQDYISGTLGGKIVVDEMNTDAISLRGWYGSKDDNEIEAYGYAFNDGEPVWSADFISEAEAAVKAAAGTDYATRYEIKVDFSALTEENGSYNLYVLVKHTNGVIYRLAKWGNITIVKGDGKNMGVDGMKDADGNVYSIRDGRVYDALNRDTGMYAVTLADGRVIAYHKLVELTVQTPMDYALDIDGKKYLYDTKVQVTDVKKPIDPEDTSVPTAAEKTGDATMSPDTLYIDETIVKDGAAHSYIAGTLGGKVRDTDRTMTSFSLRGWAHTGSNTPIVAYGYSLNDGEIVWDAKWVVEAEDGLANAAGGANTTRYKIDIDVADLADGCYNVYAFLKLEDNSVYRLATWGDFQFVKGGDWEYLGYTDGTTEYPLDSIVQVDGDVKYVLINAQDVTDGNVGDAKNKYTYNFAEAKQSSLVRAPKNPVNPADVIPVYVVDGEALNPSGGARIEDATYDYEKGCIRYTATGGDPNSSSTMVPVGTKLGRYMVMKYRTETEDYGECFTGKGGGPTGDSNVKFPDYIADGEWHYLVADLATSKDWDAETGVVNHYRNDFVQGKGHWVEVEYYAYFDSEAMAEYYGAHDMHELPQPPKTYIATFVADGVEVAKIEYQEGSKRLMGVPKVPAKEGFKGEWEKYTLNDADLTINAVYTPTGDVPPVTDKPDDPTDELGKMSSVSHLTKFGEANKSYILVEQCKPTYNDDGTITFTGKWTYDEANPATINASFTVKYCNLLSKCYDNYASEYGEMSKLPNKNGEFSVVVLKVKVPEACKGSEITLNYTSGRQGLFGYVYSDNKCEANGDFEYIFFDLSSETDFMEDFINTMKFIWIEEGEATADNVGAEVVLSDIYLFANKQEAVSALSVQWPEKATKPVATKPVETKAPAPETDEAPTEGETEAPKKDGCGSVIAGSSLLAMIVVAGAAVVAKKKKHD